MFKIIIAAFFENEPAAERIKRYSKQSSNRYVSTHPLKYFIKVFCERTTCFICSSKLTIKIFTHRFENIYVKPMGKYSI